MTTDETIAELPSPGFSATGGKSARFSQGENQRFTLDGSPALEEHLTRACARIAAGIRGLIPTSKLEAVLLGGGYGRGEGGVLRTPAGDRPYNDLEFYVCIRGNRHLNELRFGRAMHVLGEILTPQAGVEVEFKITSRQELARARPSMYSYDLVMGHRLLAGEAVALAGCDHHRNAESIPLAEATRLMMNRCTGLLLARERLEAPVFSPTAADFVARNIAKAQLALGDAVLAARGRYHWSVCERKHALHRLDPSAAMPWIDEVRRHHAAGVEFKLRPARSTAARETLARTHRQVSALAQRVWLWLEEHRLGVRLATARDYAMSSIDKCPEAAGGRNALINLKLFGARVSPGSAIVHPRNRVLNTLPLLLWEPMALDTPELLQRLQQELRTEAREFPGLMKAYRSIWEQVN